MKIQSQLMVIHTQKMVKWAMSMLTSIKLGSMTLQEQLKLCTRTLELTLSSKKIFRQSCSHRKMLQTLKITKLMIGHSGMITILKCRMKMRTKIS